MELAPLVVTRLVTCGGGEQRVRRAKAARVDDQDARLHALFDRGVVRDRVELPRAKLGAERHGEQESAHGSREGADVRSQEILDRLGHRDVLAGLELPSRDERAPELEDEERVAERRLVETPEDVPRHGQTEPRGEHPTRGSEAERPTSSCSSPRPSSARSSGVGLAGRLARTNEIASSSSLRAAKARTSADG